MPGIDSIYTSSLGAVPGRKVVGGTTTVAAATVGTTETSLFTYSVPASTFLAGVGLAFNFYGRWTRSGIGQPTIRLRLRLGGLSGLVLLDTQTIGGSTALTDGMVIWNGLLVTGTPGSSGTIWASGVKFDNASGGAGNLTATALNAAGTSGAANNAAQGTVDLTATQDLMWTCTFSANTAGNTVSVDEAVVALVQQ